MRKTPTNNSKPHYHAQTHTVGVNRPRTQKRRRAIIYRIRLTVYFVVLTAVLTTGMVAYINAGLFVDIDGADISQGTQPTTPSSSAPSTESYTDEIQLFQVPEDVTRSINTGPMLAPAAEMLALPENGRVDMAYFNTAVFLGDSLAQGFVEAYDIFPASGSVTVKGMSPDKITGLIPGPDGENITAVDWIRSLNPEKLYILMGTNGLTWMSEEMMVTSFAAMLDMFGQQLPGVKIYLMGLTPTTAEKAQDERFSNEYIRKLNDQLAAMATERNLYYINLHEVLADDLGNLKEDLAASDGYHLTKGGYEVVREYLLTHTAHAIDNEYVEGSPYYSIENPSTAPPETESSSEAVSTAATESVPASSAPTESASASTDASASDSATTQPTPSSDTVN